jgi:hypothetical protein
MQHFLLKIIATCSLTDPLLEPQHHFKSPSFQIKSLMKNTYLHSTNWLLNTAVGFIALLCATTSLQAQTTRTVCAGGCDHTTIAAAVVASASGDIIHVNTTLHTENGITITNKNLTIRGNGIATTTLQGHASRA